MRIAVPMRGLEEPGGLGAVAVNVLRRLLEVDASNEYVLLHRRPLPPEFSRPRSNVSPWRLDGPPGTAWDQFVLPHALLRLRADVVLSPFPTVPFFTRTPTVMMLAGAERSAVPDRFRRHERLAETTLRVHARRAAAVITPTDSAALDLVRWLGVREDRIARITLPPHPRFRPAGPTERARVAERYGLPPRFILTIRSPSPLGNLDLLLRAFGRLAPGTPHALVIVQRGSTAAAAGDGDIVETPGEPTAPASGHHDARLVELGVVPESDLAALYSLADLFVLPSLYERFGIPLLEAMACGCPVVASRQAASMEITDNAALLADPEDVEQMVETLRRGLGDPVLRSRLREEGLARAGRLSWDVTSRRIVQLLARVARGEPAAGGLRRAAA